MKICCSGFDDTLFPLTQPHPFRFYILENAPHMCAIVLYCMCNKRFARGHGWLGMKLLTSVGSLRLSNIHLLAHTL